MRETDLIRPTPTATCSGATYQIKPTDTFRSISQAQSISTDHLLSSNGLSYNVTSFPKSGSLCISNKCKTYVLAKDDTCTSVANKASISTVRLRSWNPNINELCRYSILVPQVDDAYQQTVTSLDLLAIRSALAIRSEIFPCQIIPWRHLLKHQRA